MTDRNCTYCGNLDPHVLCEETGESYCDTECLRDEYRDRVRRNWRAEERRGR